MSASDFEPVKTGTGRCAVLKNLLVQTLPYYLLSVLVTFLFYVYVFDSNAFVRVGGLASLFVCSLHVCRSYDYIGRIMLCYSG